MNHQSNENIFYNGPIPAGYATEIISKSGNMNNAGAHCIFLGQIRRDKKNNEVVHHIHYTAQEILAIEEFKKITDEINEDFDVFNIHVHHSLGSVAVGEICLFAFVSSSHRSACQLAMDRLIENVKKRLPIFGKESFENGHYNWKKNTEKQHRN